MSIGTLNCLVSIQSRAAGVDEVGQPNGAWTQLAQVWANVRYQRGVEVIKGGAEMSARRVSIKIRRRTDVTSAMRVVYAGTTFEVKAVLPDEEDRKYVYLACEVVA